MNKKTTTPAPAWLDDNAKTEWDRVVPALEEAPGSFYDPVLDRQLLIAYCMAHSELAFWRNERAKNGLVTSGLVERVMAAEERVLDFAGQLGLTPASRARILYDLVAGRS